MVFHDWENKHDFVKTVTGYAKIKCFCKTSLVSLVGLKCLGSAREYIRCRKVLILFEIKLTRDEGLRIDGGARTVVLTWWFLWLHVYHVIWIYDIWRLINIQWWLVSLTHWGPKETYCKISNIRRTKLPNLNVSRLVLQLSLPNPMKPSVKSRMKM